MHHRSSVQGAILLVFVVTFLCSADSAGLPSLPLRLKTTLLSPTFGFYPLKTRLKRWDYGADGCGCGTYRVDCLQDAYCQAKNKSPNWVCVKNCCGFRCVRSQ